VELDRELMLDMQLAVKDALYEGGTEDRVLASLVLMCLKEINTGRPLFENPMDEPILYTRYFKPWVQETVEKLKGKEQTE
jgi:hypothetical protein